MLNFIPMLALLGIMYFLLIRPQNQKMKQHRELLSRLKVGDEIVTNGGLYSTIVGVNDDRLQVRIAKGVEVTLSRGAVTRIQGQDGEKGAEGHATGKEKDEQKKSNGK